MGKANETYSKRTIKEDSIFFKIYTVLKDVKNRNLQNMIKKPVKQVTKPTHVHPK